MPLCGLRLLFAFNKRNDRHEGGPFLSKTFSGRQVDETCTCATCSWFNYNSGWRRVLREYAPSILRAPIILVFRLPSVSSVAARAANYTIARVLSSKAKFMKGIVYEVLISNLKSQTPHHFECIKEKNPPLSVWLQAHFAMGGLGNYQVSWCKLQTEW